MNFIYDPKTSAFLVLPAYWGWLTSGARRDDTSWAVAIAGLLGGLDGRLGTSMRALRLQLAERLPASA